MTDSIVLITGGAGNVGKAVTSAFLAAGARVAVPFYKTDQPSALDALRREHGDRLHSFALDLTTERGAEQAVRQVMEWGKRLDVVVHMVGGYTGGARLAETAVEAWDRMMDLNVKSAFLVARSALPHMVENRRGALVFVSSRAALSERAGRAAYAVAKAGVVTLAEAIAEEYGPDGIRANVIVPGTIDTEANRRFAPDADYSLWTQPEEIATVVRFLASPDASAINGAAISVCGRG